MINMGAKFLRSDPWFFALAVKARRKVLGPANFPSFEISIGIWLICIWGQPLGAGRVYVFFISLLERGVLITADERDERRSAHILNPAVGRWRNTSAVHFATIYTTVGWNHLSLPGTNAKIGRAESGIGPNRDGKGRENIMATTSLPEHGSPVLRGRTHNERAMLKDLIFAR